MDISILICTHNRSEILARTLACVERLVVPAGREVELVVIANNCSDETVEVAASGIDRIPFPSRVIEEPVPGLSVARNRALRESSGEICAFLDDDVQFEPTWLGELLDFFATHPASIAGGRVRLWWDAVERPEWFTRRLDHLLSATNLGEEPVELKTGFVGIAGANFWLRREVWQAVGDFDPNLGRVGKALVAGEESDFILRARDNGFRVFYTPTAALDHWVAPSRVEPDYLLPVAAGTARGRIRMKPPLSLAGWSRSLLGNGYRVVAHGLRAVAIQTLAGRHRALDAWACCYAGVGSLQGLWDRLSNPGLVRRSEAG